MRAHELLRSPDSTRGSKGLRLVSTEESGFKPIGGWLRNFCEVMLAPGLQSRESPNRTESESDWLSLSRAGCLLRQGCLPGPQAVKV